MNDSLIDFHCHLDLYPGFEEVVNECEEKMIHTLSVTTTPKAWPENFRIINTKKFVRCALGLHPQLVAERFHELSLWDEFLPQARYIGEVGLDASPRFYNSFDKQKAVFEHILKSCTNAGGKILSIHSVRSAPIVLAMLEKHLAVPKNKVVLHWFTGNVSNAIRAIDMGCYFSFNREMLSTKNGLELLKGIPVQKLLTETDGPFTGNDGIPYRPKDVIGTLEKLTTVLDKSIVEVRQILNRNLEVLES
jgi:TatD DNase family protein